MDLFQVSRKIAETYNIGGHNEKQNIEVVNTICELLEELAPDKPGKIQNYKDLITFVQDRAGHDVRYAIDASKIHKELGWRAPRKVLLAVLGKQYNGIWLIMSGVPMCKTEAIKENGWEIVRASCCFVTHP